MRKKCNSASNGYLPGGPTPTAKERMELYYLAHPSSPSAVRRPRVSMRGDLWVALLGPTVEKGVVGIGRTVEAALRAFDAQYFNLLRPATEATKIRDSAYRACNRAAQIQPGFRCIEPVPKRRRPDREMAIKRPPVEEPELVGASAPRSG